jgi:CRP-like cAMP-binding protein
MLRCAMRRRQTTRTPFVRAAEVAPWPIMAGREELVDAIASFALFADLPDPRLEGIVHLFEEVVFGEGDKVLRQGLTGSGFYVILDGEAAVLVDGTERARLGRGEFFGEVSIILGESPIADIVAVRPLRCLVLAGPRVEPFLLDHPRVMYRMLQVQARRLRAANRWRS